MRSLVDIAFNIFREKDRKRQLSEELIKHRFQDQKSDYSNTRAPKTDKHGGYITSDGVVVAQTNSCCHCGAHWVVRPGSGTLRGFCTKCMQTTCGHPNCDASGPRGCVPWLKQMEAIEAR